MKTKKHYILLIGLVLISFSCNKETVSLIKDYGTVSDIDGNVYQTVLIENQWWMAENLKTTIANDGTPLDSSDFFWYDDDETTYKDLLGALYTIDVVNKICPVNWHLSGYKEWHKLEDNLGINPIQKMLETIPVNPDCINATNESGLSIRLLNSGYIYYLGESAYFWHTGGGGTQYEGNVFSLNCESETLHIFDSGYGDLGFSVRCVKD